MPLPLMLPIRQNFPDLRIYDIPGEIQQQMDAALAQARIDPGARIAIGVGSRGINNIQSMVKAVVDYFISRGAEPFLFPAMGSHGGATAEGQVHVLDNLGIRDSLVGCPIISSMETVSTGQTPEGINIFMDRNAFESDGVFIINRVKGHTDFKSQEIGSGLLKMLAIGMGKQKGAEHYHARGREIGLEGVIRSVGRHHLASDKILGGLAILEDANNNTTQLTAILAQDMENKEIELFARARGLKGSLPMDLDILILDEMGKTISGPGMDPNVINRSTDGKYNPWWENMPRIGKIYVRSLRSDSSGNGNGIWLPDVVRSCVITDINMAATEINARTAFGFDKIQVPPHFETDRECIKFLTSTMPHIDPANLRIGRITNTLRLNELWLSENLRAEIVSNPNLKIVGEAIELTSGDTGQIPVRPFEFEHQNAGPREYTFD